MIAVDMTDIFVSVIASLFGMAYFIYGKKITSFSYMTTGGIMVSYSYFVTNPYVSALICLLLILFPPMYNRYF